MQMSYGKWKKYKLMREEKKLHNYLPETHLLTENSFFMMIDKYQQVMIKPNQGYRGKGIVQITSLGNEEYELHSLYTVYTLKGRKQTFDHIKSSFCKKRKYIVQQRIPLASINNLPYDIRVMVQRKKDSSLWEVTGKLAKIAAKRFVITNYCKEVLSVEKAIGQSSFEKPAQNILSSIDQVCLLAAESIGPYYQNSRIIGFDVGLDRAGRLWIIEANLTPCVLIFKNFEDHSMYKNILNYKRRGT